MNEVEELRRQIHELQQMARKRGLYIITYEIQRIVDGEWKNLPLKFTIEVDESLIPRDKKGVESRRVAALFISKWVKEYIRRFEEAGYSANSAWGLEYGLSTFVERALSPGAWPPSDIVQVDHLPRKITTEEASRILNIAKKWLEDVLDDFTHNTLPKLIALSLKS